MASKILDERDQQFVLHEMLEVEKLCGYERFSDFSRDMFDMILTEARKMGTEVVFPTLSEGDKQGCRLVDGKVSVPECYHKRFSSSVKAAGSAWASRRRKAARDCRTALP